jgi:hypothetical protein
MLACEIAREGGSARHLRTLSHACTAHRSGSSSSLCMGWPSSQPLTVTRNAPSADMLCSEGGVLPLQEAVACFRPPMHALLAAAPSTPAFASLFRYHRRFGNALLLSATYKKGTATQRTSYARHKPAPASSRRPHRGSPLGVRSMHGDSQPSQDQTMRTAVVPRTLKNQLATHASYSL